MILITLVAVAFFLSTAWCYFCLAKNSIKFNRERQIIMILKILGFGVVFLLCLLGVYAAVMMIIPYPFGDGRAGLGVTMIATTLLLPISFVGWALYLYQKKSSKSV